MTQSYFFGIASGVVVSSVFGQSIIVDGKIDKAELKIYGAEVFVQDTNTQFGDATDGLQDFCNGSEIDAAHLALENGYLYIFLAGNLQSNFNKLDIFVDAREGGQPRLLGNNPDIDFNGLNRMGEDNDSGNGIRFDKGFAPDMFITLTGGNDPYEMYATYSEIRTDGEGFGEYLGQGSAGLEGQIVSPNGMILAIDNSNIEGVSGDLGVGCGEGVVTGIEIAIPAYLFDWEFEGIDVKSFSMTAFVNGSGHDFVSNQVVGGLFGANNLGEPRDIDFNLIPGNQYAVLGEIWKGPCPEPPLGACCLGDVCTIASIADCASQAGTYQGDGTSCEEDPCAPPPPACEGDLNNDGVVNTLDLLIVIGNFGSCSG